MRAVGHELLGQRQYVVVLLAANQVAEVLHPGSGIHFFGNNQRFGIEIERNRSIGTRSGGRRLYLSLGRLHPRDGVHDGLQVLGRRAATSAYNAHSVFGHKTLVILGEFVRGELINRAPAFVVRKSGVG